MKETELRISELARRVSESLEAEEQAPTYPRPKTDGFAVSSTSGVVEDSEHDFRVSDNGKDPRPKGK